MIDYSVYMMKNQMKPEEPAKAYAKNQVREIWDLNKFNYFPLVSGSTTNLVFVFLRLHSGSFYFVVIWKKRVRRLPRLRSILSI